MTRKPARTIKGLWKRVAAAESETELLGEVQAFASTRCGAHARTTGQPCRAPRVPGKRRCWMHGGLSTGPKSPDGRRRALMNLLPYSSGAVPLPPLEPEPGAAP